jgi:hypothetical protein
MALVALSLFGCERISPRTAAASKGPRIGYLDTGSETSSADEPADFFDEEWRIIAVHQQLGVDVLHQVDLAPPAQVGHNLEQARASGAQALVPFAPAAISVHPTYSMGAADGESRA